MPITKREADDLRRVTKTRFEILREQLQQRRMEIENMVRREVEAEYADAVQVARETIRKLRSDTEKLATKVEVTLRPLIDEGFVLNRYGYKDLVFMRVDEDDARIPNLANKIHERVREIEEQHGLAKLNLRHQEASFLEKLALGTIETDEAREFFDGLPVIDEYLPLPSGTTHKALTA